MNTERKIKNLWSIVLIEMTNCCNFSCEFCPSDVIKRKKAFMQKDLWKKVIKEIGEKQMAHTVFLNLLGEPLLHEDVFDAIKYANDLGLKVSLYSNGALLDDQKSERLLNALKKGRIVLSLQEIVPKNFAHRSHNKLNWDEYVNKLKKFTIQSEAKGIDLQVHCMVDIQSSGWNIAKILKSQKAVQNIYDQWAQALNTKESNKINILDPSAFYNLGKTTSFFVKHHGWWSNRHIPDYAKVVPCNSAHCALMNDTFAILTDGTCTYCCTDFEGELSLGNAMESSLEDIFYSEKAVKIREKEASGEMIMDICRICRGKLIDKRNNKLMTKRNIFSNYYFFKDHLNRYGWLSSFKKVKEYLKRK